MQEEHFGRKQNHDITGYNILPYGYCTYRNRSDGIDFTFNINKCCKMGIISKFYPVFYGNKNNINLISIILNNSKEVAREIGYTCSGTGQKVLSFLDLQKMNIIIPNRSEQDKISDLFDNLDNLITLHQRKFNYILSHKLEIKLFFFIITKNVWEQRELFDVADYRNGKAHENDIDNDGKYIVINSKFVSTEGKIKKYSNKQNEPLFQNEIAFVLSDVPNGRAIAKTFLVDKSSKYTLNQRIAGITPHSNINPKFLSITMNRNKYFLQFDDGVKQTNLSLNDMKKFEEFYPNKQEQDKIGDLFTNLDNLITLHQRKCTYIFYSWEQRKLDRLLEQYTEVTTINNQYPALTSSRKGIFFQTEYFAGNQIASQNNVGYNIVPRNYFTYRHMSDDEIFHFNINDICDFGIVSTLYPVFTTKKELDSKYLQSQLNYGKEFAKFASLQKQGGSRTYMYFAKLKELVLTMPKVEEQTKISSILSNIDNLITLHQHKELKRRNDNNDNLRW